MHVQDVHVSDLHVFVFTCHVFVLCVLNPAIIVLDATCAGGTPWTFLLTFLNKGC